MTLDSIKDRYLATKHTSKTYIEAKNKIGSKIYSYELGRGAEGVKANSKVRSYKTYRDSLE